MHAVAIFILIPREKLHCLAAGDANKRDFSATEDTAVNKTDKKNVTEELATKFQQSSYAQRFLRQCSKQFHSLLYCFNKLILSLN